MKRPERLPPELAGSSFTTRAGAVSGLSPKRLRARDLDKHIWGVRSAGAIATLDQRARMMLLRMPPSAFVSHLTAAVLHRLPTPPASFSSHDAVDISVPAPERAPHATGIRGHRLTLFPGDVQAADGIRITSPVRTWFDLGASLRIEDLVAIGDHLIATPGGPSREDLAGTIASHRGERGVRRLALASRMLTPRSESPQESRLRALIMMGGLPEPSVNRVITDGLGRFVARADLVIEEYRLVIEYQGDYHRDKAQWRRDMSRRSRIEAEGWTVVEIVADDLCDPDELLARFRKLARMR
ncbi:endonuclease domain-containing protein [Amnibacterium flavum]|uniref:DUF559 domain-containing protein n=1 Tax=Amnibacterium flavum TaxID=2173173 RepID=A0A2V1HQ40_9MICO|nr:DUF559 domain-containing protein [Amnibacterium flavum]PVZ94655.1 hypothetical protein DDQ50_13260 [Amnibacterium flavum]